jgi:hypothetical protein
MQRGSYRSLWVEPPCIFDVSRGHVGRDSRRIGGHASHLSVSVLGIYLLLVHGRYHVELDFEVRIQLSHCGGGVVSRRRSKAWRIAMEQCVVTVVV